MAKDKVKRSTGYKNLKLRKTIWQNLYTNAFEIFVFKDRKSMVNGICKWAKLNKYKLNFEDLEVMALIFENESLPEVEIDGYEYRMFATIFFNEEDLNINIIAHECVHAAFILERNVLRYIGNYVGNNGTGISSEERYAYNVDNFLAKVVQECLAAKLKVKVKV